MGNWKLAVDARSAAADPFHVPMEAHRLTMQKVIEAWTIGLRLVPDGDSLSPGSKPVFLTQRSSPSKITLRQFVLENGPDPSHTLQNSGGRYHALSFPSC